MLTLVDRLKENKRASPGAMVFRKERSKERLFIAVDTVDRKPIRLPKSDNRGVGRRPAVGRHQVLGILLKDALGQFRDGPLVLLGRSKVAAHHPDEVRQVLEALAHKSSVVAKFRFATSLHVLEPALIATTVPEVSREQPNGDTSVVGLLYHVVSKVEVTSFLEWQYLGARCRGVCAK